MIEIIGVLLIIGLFILVWLLGGFLHDKIKGQDPNNDAIDYSSKIMQEIRLKNEGEDVLKIMGRVGTLGDIKGDPYHK